MKRLTLLLLSLMLLTLSGAGCVPEEPEDPTTEAFRFGLLAEGDLQMEFAGQQAQALITASQPLGNKSLLAHETARSVVGTNLFLLRLVLTMRYIASFPPAVAEEDRHVWEGSHQGVFLRVTVEREDGAEGATFPFLFEGRPAGTNDELVPLIEGWALRFVDGEQLLRQGYGQVYYDFDGINALYPQEGIGGEGMATFRHAGGVHQVDVRLHDAFSPQHPDFPPLASYTYFQRPDNSGGFSWISSADYLDDGEPFEDIHARVEWNGDLSGAGVARLTGGSMEVEYWALTDCWNGAFDVLYTQLAAPNFSVGDGTLSSCPVDPGTLVIPTAEELGSHWPEIPAAHADEQ